MPSRNRSSSKNNNPDGRNQYSNGWMDTAKDRPMAAAAAAAAAVGAGVFLWSRRNQISDQLSSMSDQISQWSEGMRSSDGSGSSLQSTGSADLEMAGAGTTGIAGSTTGSSRATGGRRGKAQTGQNMNPSRGATPAGM